jgi:hypothetical protein
MPTTPVLASTNDRHSYCQKYLKLNHDHFFLNRTLEKAKTGGQSINPGKKMHYYNGNHQTS